MSKSTTTSDSNATALRAFNAAIFDEHDLDAIETFLAPDVVHYQAGTEVARGFDGSREYFGAVLSAFPDIDLTIVELVADEERAICRFEATGTHEGALPVAGDGDGTDVIEPTGRTVTWQGFVSTRFEDGKIAEATLISDQYGMAMQLGLISDDN